jgi:hypothetical protein
VGLGRLKLGRQVGQDDNRKLKALSFVHSHHPDPFTSILHDRRFWSFSVFRVSTQLVYKGAE